MSGDFARMGEPTLGLFATLSIIVHNICRGFRLGRCSREYTRQLWHKLMVVAISVPVVITISGLNYVHHIKH